MGSRKRKHSVRVIETNPREKAISSSYARFDKLRVSGLLCTEGSRFFELAREREKQFKKSAGASEMGSETEMFDLGKAC